VTTMRKSRANIRVLYIVGPFSIKLWKSITMNPTQKKRKRHLVSIANKQKICEPIKKAKKCNKKIQLTKYTSSNSMEIVTLKHAKITTFFKFNNA
jgi:hypothetical protein